MVAIDSTHERGFGYRYFLLNKPCGFISQFTSAHRKNRKLGELYDFPEDVNPIGRLDKDSEGLLILTNDGALHQSLLNPENGHEREYWAQVHGEPTDKALADLYQEVTISIEGQTYQTRPAFAQKLSPQPSVPARGKPLNARGPYPTPWIRLVLTEGKYRQARKMTAAVGLPTLRLIRKRIGGLTLDLYALKAGEVQEVSREYLYQALFHRVPD